MGQLNERALLLGDMLVGGARHFGIERHVLACGTVLLDCGVKAPGSVEAGLYLARICLADLAEVRLVDGQTGFDTSTASLGASVQVVTDQPIVACMAAQYAGWEVRGKDYFAMGSGPMRAVAAREPLFEEPLFADGPYREKSESCVGVLESGQFPTEPVCQQIADECGIESSRLMLLVAPTRSKAGMLQIVARSVETALHKLHELGFDLGRVVHGCGTAPLPPPTEDDLAALGRTNDAILYGGEVTLKVRGDDESLQAIGPKTPSSASSDHGKPFAQLFADAGHDFYQIDPLLFSPAVVTLENIETGNHFRYGHTAPDLLELSFGYPTPFLQRDDTS